MDQGERILEYARIMKQVSSSIDGVTFDGVRVDIDNKLRVTDFIKNFLSKLVEDDYLDSVNTPVAAEFDDRWLIAKKPNLGTRIMSEPEKIIDGYYVETDISKLRAKEEVRRIVYNLCTNFVRKGNDGKIPNKSDDTDNKDKDGESSYEESVDLLYREEIGGDDSDEVLILSTTYDSGEDEYGGIEGFLKKFQSWGTLNIGKSRDPHFIALYVKDTELEDTGKEIKYVCEIENIIHKDKFQQKHNVDISSESWNRKNQDKIAEFDSIYKLRDPIPLGDGYARKFSASGTYTTINSLVEADDASEV